MRTSGVSAVICFLILFSLSCSPRLEKEKFSKAQAAALEVKSAIDAGAEYSRCRQAVKKFSDEVSALERRAASYREKEIAGAFSTLLDIYRDGLVLWDYRIEFERYGFVPGGRIYAGQYADPVIKKYSIPVEFHVYKQTGQKWKSIPSDSIRGIWANAGSQLKIIKGMLESD